MSMSISSIRIPQAPEPVQSTTRVGAERGFQATLESAISEVEKSSGSAATSVRQFLNGETEELHNTVLATQKAELQLEMFLQVRNKVVSAYQEIMKMQV